MGNKKKRTLKNKSENLGVTVSKPDKEPSTLHKLIIDTYYTNGFNGQRAVMEHKPDVNYYTAQSLFRSLMKSENNLQYIKDKQLRLSALTDIKNEMVLRELINWAYLDATEFINLTPDEIKNLPNDVKRCIQSFKHNNKSYVNRQGIEVHEQTIEVKLIDKTKAIEMINKHIGFYEADNKSKPATINIAKLDNVTLNVLNNALRNRN